MTSDEHKGTIEAMFLKYETRALEIKKPLSESEAA
jgi:hypothetical protein